MAKINCFGDENVTQSRGKLNVFGAENVSKPKGHNAFNDPDTTQKVANTKSKGNANKAGDGMIADCKEKGSFYKKIKEEERTKGTWGGGTSRP